MSKNQHGVTVGELIGRIAPQMTPDEPLMKWPPDTFAVACHLLTSLGLLNEVSDLNDIPVRPKCSWIDHIRRLGDRWRVSLSKVRDFRQVELAKVPKELEKWWKVLMSQWSVDVTEIGRQWSALQEVALIDGTNARQLKSSTFYAMVSLMVAADEASWGFGVDTTGLDPSYDRAAELCDVAIVKNGHQSVCHQISRRRAKVLPKQHTPQRGVSVRGLTHNLALCPVTVDSKWFNPPVTLPGDRNRANFILVPYPFVMSPLYFTAVDGKSHLGGGFFSFVRSSSDSSQIEDILRQSLRAAGNHVKPCDVTGFIFPEASLTNQEYQAARDFCDKEKKLLIAGICSSDKAPVNRSVIYYGPLIPEAAKGTFSSIFEHQQSKLHRWCLDRGQVFQYSLGAALPPFQDWWEHIAIDRKHVNFVNLDQWLTITTLVCEDLARNDSIAETIRSVGPNLVVALLMDGPQLDSRWSSKYASILAEDPGCSVLCLTCLGMTQRSFPRDYVEGDVLPHARTIALWRDAKYRQRSITLPENADACLLCLTLKRVREFTIDGRHDNTGASLPVYAGHYPLLLA